jgi:hypothetical protein
MRRRVIVPLLASLGVLGALAPSASGSANATHGSCVAQFTSNQSAGEAGATISVLAHEAQPFGQNVVSVGAGLKEPCE